MLITIIVSVSIVDNIEHKYLMLMFYSGIRMMLNQWNGQGFGYDLRKFIYIIETGNIKKAEAEVLHMYYSRGITHVL